MDLGRPKSAVDRPEGMVLDLKGRFLPADVPEREEQLEFDRRLVASGIVTPDGKGPGLAELQELLPKRRGAQSGASKAKPFCRPSGCRAFSREGGHLRAARKDGHPATHYNDIRFADLLASPRGPLPSSPGTRGTARAGDRVRLACGW